MIIDLEKAPVVSASPVFRLLSDALGVEAVGIDASRPQADHVIAALAAALDQHGIVLMRNQTLTPDEHIAFSRRFGALQEVAQKQYQMPGKPLIYVIGNVVENGRAVADPSVGRLWHSDQSFLQHPALGSVLYGLECPPVGADTLFANSYAAYEALSPARQTELEGLRAVHSFADYYEGLRQRDASQPVLTSERKAMYPDVVHPLVRQNPRTRRKALYFNPGYVTQILGVSDAESDALIRELTEHCTRARFVHAHKWRSGDLLMWDNLGVNHKGTPFETERYVRRMHRTTIAGNADIYRASLLQ